MHSLIRLLLVPVLTSLAVAAHAQDAAKPVGSFDPASGSADGKVDCPGAGGWGDVSSALLYELPNGDHVVTVYRRDDDTVSILVSKQLSCMFRRMEFHSPARGQPLPQ